MVLDQYKYCQNNHKLIDILYPIRFHNNNYLYLLPKRNKGHLTNKDHQDQLYNHSDLQYMKMLKKNFPTNLVHLKCIKAK